MATRGNRSTNAGLQSSVDRLSEAFERMADRLEAIESRGEVSPYEADPMIRFARRWGPFIALGLIFAIFLAILPSRPGGDSANEASSLTPNDDFSGDTGGADIDTGSLGTGSTGGSGSGVGVGPGNTGNVTVPAVGKAEPPKVDWLKWQATGKTIGGFDCTKGIRQIPWSKYAVPCFPAWVGNNGGATHRGVTAKEVIIVERRFPDTANGAAVDAAVQQAGFASADEREATRTEFIKYFNKIFEMWGRKLKVVPYVSEFGDSTAEAQSKGKDGACADADDIIDTYKPFMVIGEGSTAPFGECGAERKLMVEGAGAYYPEKWYADRHPYLWSGVMECERIAYMNAEYLGKRLANRPAKWAKGVHQGRPRKFGLYVPNNDQYQYCVNISEREGQEKYNAKISSRYDYILDISRFPDEAAKGVVQFNADGVTTVILACDPLSPIFLTQSARGQNYYPEWITNSAGLTDVEEFARLWDQREIQWSLFGMSQLGNAADILSNKGEATVTYKKATGTQIPAGAQTEYFALMRLFGMIQAAGPNLSPTNITAGMWRLPVGGAPPYEVGRTGYLTDSRGRPGHDHTAVDDMREIYWLCTKFDGDALCTEPKAPDGSGGVYIATYGGKRFYPGEFPTGDPPIFKEKP